VIDWYRDGNWAMCYWAEPDRIEAQKSKPCPEARLIRVEIRPVPVKRAKKRGKGKR
jgi:hypothetical protein